MSKLDRYDLSILAELQRDARISNQELAERIGLSPSPCSRRVKQLEDDGYISRQVALLDRKMLGLSLTAYVLIGMDRHTPERFENFEAAIRTLPQVLECSLVTGMDADYQLKVVVPDMDHYQKLLLGHLCPRCSSPSRPPPRGGSYSCLPTATDRRSGPAHRRARQPGVRGGTRGLLGGHRAAQRISEHTQASPPRPRSGRS